MTEVAEKKPDNNMRRLARLASVQGLYQIALTGEASDAVIGRFRKDPDVLLQEEHTMTAVDIEMFCDIVAGVSANLADLDVMIDGALDERFSLARLEPLLKAILRAGAFELHHRGTIQTGIIVNDYVDVAHGFFDAKEPGLVNAILDKLAKSLRS